MYMARDFGVGICNIDNISVDELRNIRVPRYDVTASSLEELRERLVADIDNTIQTMKQDAIR